jgi:PAS domain S-box-containing protein
MGGPAVRSIDAGAHGAFLLTLSDAVREAADPVEVQSVAARLLCRHLKANRVVYAELTEREAVVVGEYVDGVRSVVGRFPLDGWGESHLASWRRGEATAVDDIHADPDLPEAVRASWRAVEVAAYVGMTLTTGGRMVAALGVHSATARRWTNDEIALTREVAERTWAAVERARVEAALRESDQRYAAIFDGAPFAIALVRLSDGVVVSANAAFFRLFELTADEVLGRSAFDLGIVGVDEQAEIARELRARGSVRDFPCTHRTQSGATRLLSLNVDFATVQGERHTLTTIRDLTALRQAEEDRERLRDLDAMERLQRVNARFFSAPEPSAILDEILDAAIAIAEADFGCVQVFDPRTGDLTIALHRGLPAWWREFWSRVSAGRGACGTALERSERVIVEDVAESALFDEAAREVQLRAGIRAVQSTPLVARSGAPLGMISTHFRTPHRPPPRVLRLLDLLARQAADVLERSHADAALRRAEARSTGILVTSADAIISIDEKGAITLFNQSAERMFGYTRDEVIGGPLDRLLPARHRAPHREHIGRFADEPLTARAMDHRTAVGLRRDGSEFPISATISKLDVDGERILTVSVRDMTEERRRETKQRMLAELGGALVSLDFDGALESVARLAVREIADFSVLFTIDENGLLRRSGAASRDPALAWCAEVMVQAPAAPTASHPVWAVIEAHVPLRKDWAPGEYEALAQSPEHLFALRTARPRSTIGIPLVAGDRTVGALFVASASRLYDDDDLRFLEELGRRCALFIENARLHRNERRAIQSRDDVLGIVAHDLRNPLGTILMQAGLLQHLGALHGQTHRPAEVIQRAARRMNRIIQDLLDVTRMEAGSLSLERAPLPTVQLLAELIESQRAQLPASRAVTLRLAVDGALPPVWADRHRLQQIVENLVGNAVKFTTAGEVTVGARPHDGGDVLFWVRDCGPGISAEQLPHLFDRFWQGRTSARHGGVGLGLAIVKGLVEAHGGRIWAESELGVGSTFWFTLPGAPSHARAGRVLIADDDDDLRGAMATVLERAGYEVVAVANGAEALALLQQAPAPSVVILDLTMPVADGWSVLAERARDPRLLVIPVIVASGLTGVERRVAEAQARFVHKPVLPEELVAIVDEATRR